MSSTSIFRSAYGLWISIIVLAVTSLLKYRFSHDSTFAERFYSLGVFSHIRRCYDYTLAILPFSSVYLFVAGTVIVFALIIRRSRGIKRLLRILSVIILLYCGFYWIWGYNYYRPSLQQKLQAQENKITPDEILNEIRVVTKRIKTLSAQANTTPPSDMDARVNDAVRKTIQKWGYLSDTKARVKTIYPAGILLRFSTSGMYFPYAMEGIVDAGLHDLQVPATVAHEYGHVYGIGGESSCNLLAYLACNLTDDPYIMYSGTLMYWRYLASYIKRTYPDEYQQIYSDLPSRTKKDLQDIYTQMNKYPDILPQLRNMIYDSYLRSHGVAGGIDNYSYVIDLVHTWKNSPLRDEQLYNILYGSE